MDPEAIVAAIAELKKTVELEGGHTREALSTIQKQIEGVCDTQQADHDSILTISGRLDGLAGRVDTVEGALVDLKKRDTVGTVFASFIGPFAAIIGHFIK